MGEGTGAGSENQRGFQRTQDLLPASLHPDVPTGVPGAWPGSPLGMSVHLFIDVSRQLHRTPRGAASEPAFGAKTLPPA